MVFGSLHTVGSPVPTTRMLELKFLIPSSRRTRKRRSKTGDEIEDNPIHDVSQLMAIPYAYGFWACHPFFVQVEFDFCPCLGAAAQQARTRREPREPLARSKTRSLIFNQQKPDSFTWLCLVSHCILGLITFRPLLHHLQLIIQLTNNNNNNNINHDVSTCCSSSPLGRTCICLYGCSSYA